MEPKSESEADYESESDSVNAPLQLVFYQSSTIIINSVPKSHEPLQLSTSLFHFR